MLICIMLNCYQINWTLHFMMGMLISLFLC
uniref:Uncharacterized protein n=1 Tax=Arundo donax TaxID=35708 RepID=A0A0A9G5L8_ARUDO